MHSDIQSAFWGCHNEFSSGECCFGLVLVRAGNFECWRAKTPFSLAKRKLRARSALSRNAPGSADSRPISRD